MIKALGNSMFEELELFFDGGSRGNPGPAGYGTVIFDVSDHEKIVEAYGFLGEVTNNNAEYNGLIAGLELAHKINPSANIKVYADSKLVVEQMSGRWKIKDENLLKLAQKAYNSFPQSKVTYYWIPREKNKIADMLANEAMDKEEIKVTWHNPIFDNELLKEKNIIENPDTKKTKFFDLKTETDFPTIRTIFLNLESNENIKEKMGKTDRILKKYSVEKITNILLCEEYSEYFETTKECFNSETKNMSIEIFEDICEKAQINMVDENILFISKKEENQKIINSFIQPVIAKYIPKENTIDIIEITPCGKKNIISCMGIKID